MCCSVLQCVAMWYSVLQCVAVGLEHNICSVIDRSLLETLCLCFWKKIVGLFWKHCAGFFWKNCISLSWKNTYLLRLFHTMALTNTLWLLLHVRACARARVCVCMCVCECLYECVGTLCFRLCDWWCGFACMCVSVNVIYYVYM